MTFDPVIEQVTSAQGRALNFFPATGSEMDWNAAFFRVEDYLRALHVSNKIHQSQVILEILEAAAARHRVEPDESPTTLAMRECQERLSRWFEQMLEHPGRYPVAGLLPLYLADGAAEWPEAFLAPDAPEAFRRSLREHDLEASPEIEVSRMVPRPLDVSPLLEGLFHEGWEKMDAVTALIAFMAAGSIVATVFFFLT